jgi:hypothetical protein
MPGKFLGLPYDWRKPTKARLRSKAWNKDAKIFTPHAFGWGYGINVRAVWSRRFWR